MLKEYDGELAETIKRGALSWGGALVGLVLDSVISKNVETGFARGVSLGIIGSQIPYIYNEIKKYKDISRNSLAFSLWSIGHYVVWRCLILKNY